MKKNIVIMVPRGAMIEVITYRYLHQFPTPYITGGVYFADSDITVVNYYVRTQALLDEIAYAIPRSDRLGAYLDVLTELRQIFLRRREEVYQATRDRVEQLMKQIWDLLERVPARRI
jgi:hypothetical protein